MPTVHTMPNDGTHEATLSCWCCPVAHNPDTLAEVSNDEAAMREALNEPLHVIHNQALPETPGTTVPGVSQVENATRELTEIELCAAEDVCIERGHFEGGNQDKTGSCPTCRADIVRLVDAPPPAKSDAPLSEALADIRALNTPLPSYAELRAGRSDSPTMTAEDATRCQMKTEDGLVPLADRDFARRILATHAVLQEVQVEHDLMYKAALKLRDENAALRSENDDLHGFQLSMRLALTDDIGSDDDLLALARSLVAENTRLRTTNSTADEKEILALRAENGRLAAAVDWWRARDAEQSGTAQPHP